jgi:glycyl-tRNA synthetase beta chain
MPTPALLKKTRKRRHRPGPSPVLERRMDGKAEALFLTASCPVPRSPTVSSRASKQALKALPIPKVMSYLGRRRRHLRAPGAQAGRAARRRCGARPRARPGVRSYHARPPLHESRRHLTSPPPTPTSRRCSPKARSSPASPSVAPTSRSAQLLAAGCEGRAALPIEDADAARRSDGAGRTRRCTSAAFEEEFLAVPQECLILTMRPTRSTSRCFDAPAS